MENNALSKCKLYKTSFWDAINERHLKEFRTQLLVELFSKSLKFYFFELKFAKY